MKHSETKRCETVAAAVCVGGDRAESDNFPVLLQLRCEKNPQRLDLPVRRSPSGRAGSLTKSWSASHADREPRPEPDPEPEPEPEPPSRSARSSWRQQEIVSRSGRPQEQEREASSWRQRLSTELDIPPVRRSYGELPGTPGGWRARLSGDLCSARLSPPRRWSLLADTGDTAPPSTPQRKSKHKKKVNFLGEDELIQPVPGRSPFQCFWSRTVWL